MSFFIDTHCHLNFNLFQDDLSRVLDRARGNQVRCIVIPGTDLLSSRSAVTLCEGHSGLYAAVGVHPNDAEGWDANAIANLRELAASSFVRAVGEIGLDYYRDVTDRKKQKLLLSSQLSLAEELDLPVVIHNRSSIQDLWPILKEWASGLPSAIDGQKRMHGILHSFDGEIDLANEAYAAGFFLGISGPITYKNAGDRRQVLTNISVESIVLETDAPFLTPHPYRGQRNEPAYIPIIANEIARIKQIDLTEVQLITSRNAMQLFSLGSID